MKKYDLSQIMKRAWVIYRKHNHKLSWSDSLKESWSIAKNGVGIVTFEQVYTKYNKLVLNFVNSRIHDMSMAEEITQDIFVRVNTLLNEGRYDVMKASFKTLLFTMAKNAIIDQWRKRKMNTVHTDGYVNDEGTATFEYVADEADTMETTELHEQIENAFAQLKERERSVMTMFYFENRKQDEIAELLGMSVSNVKVTILRTKEKLQTMLKGAYSLLG